MSSSPLRSNNLAEQLSDVLSRQIASGERAAGSRLPTEERLAAEYGVSRTVVREAIARLKSDGLVTTRQGLGAFVAATPMGRPFRIGGERQEAHAVVQQVFELRIGVETEAAALAAARATPVQVKDIRNALKVLNKASLRGGDGVEEDILFHRAIARAAKNPVYDDFFEFLERYTRTQLSISRRNCELAGWLSDITMEHEAIYEAIAAHDPIGARVAAHAHMSNAMARLQRIQAH
ncbi:MAG: FadR/GntR family transcriptional regulator [Pigmentiphaga sp.]|uniref:FadR/GntR family transcriptional regulator n=1 Tax=Pigmentiphaga sp. TaxID=1977564 RepID=UPI0029AA4071|nr:FadR/GntR family transcriptional regulator [Pigmentiphaga sp.]MDX3906739.1 FadR/GntR family transcriptional regulator [Pigmentiphaga sp.]